MGDSLGCKGFIIAHDVTHGINTAIKFDDSSDGLGGAIDFEPALYVHLVLHLVRDQALGRILHFLDSNGYNCDHYYIHLVESF